MRHPFAVRQLAFAATGFLIAALIAASYFAIYGSGGRCPDCHIPTVYGFWGMDGFQDKRGHQCPICGRRFPPGTFGEPTRVKRARQG